MRVARGFDALTESVEVEGELLAGCGIALVSPGVDPGLIAESLVADAPMESAN